LKQHKVKEMHCTKKNCENARKAESSNPDGPKPSLSVGISGGIVLSLDKSEVPIGNMTDLTLVPRWLEAANSLVRGSKKETVQFSANVNDSAVLSRYGIYGGDRLIFRYKKSVYCFNFDQFCLQLYISAEGLSGISSKIFSRFATFKKDKVVDIPPEIIEQEGLFTNLLQFQSLEAGLKSFKQLLESRAVVGTHIFEDYFAAKRSSESKKQNNSGNNFREQRKPMHTNSFYADLIAQSCPQSNDLQRKADEMTLKAEQDRVDEIIERVNLQKKEKEMRELLKDTSVLRKRDENGKYILKPVVIEETVTEEEPIEEPKTTQIIRKTVMEKDEEGYLRPVTGVFELNLLTNQETLKQKISVTTTSEKSETIIDSFDLEGKIMNQEIIVKKIAPVVVEQKNTKDQKNSEVRKKFVEANHEVDPNIELAEQKIRNAKALALVKEKERIAKEKAEKEKQKAEKERLKQEKEFAQKVARDHDAQKKP